jgi:hypothetical protein
MVVRFIFGISQFMEKMHMCLKGVGMFITDNTGMGLYFEEVDGRW